MSRWTQSMAATSATKMKLSEGKKASRRKPRLLSPTELVATAHRELMADGIKGRSRRENVLVQTFATIPHASSKSWGTYLLSLCFRAHSFSGIELRYSFSDNFNWLTITSNEVGVLGMSPQGLPQFELLLIRNFRTSQTILSGREPFPNERKSL